MAKLYPPVIESTLPAFCLQMDKNKDKLGAVLHINFALNKAVAEAEIKNIVLSLRTISTNTPLVIPPLVLTDTSTGQWLAQSVDTVIGECIFNINDSDTLLNLHVGQYYKVQLAFVGLDNQIGYFSTVGIIKCVAQPKAYIANYKSADLNIFTTEIIGVYEQDTSTGDSSEKAYSYRFQLWNEDKELIEDSTILLHNSSADTSSFSSTDKFISRQNLKDNKIYKIQYTVTTLNGVTVSTPIYSIINGESIDLEYDLTLIPTMRYDEGVVDLQLCLRGKSLEDSTAVTGSFMLLRSSSLDQYATWQEVQRFRLTTELPANRILRDYTIEQGITYHYGIRQYNRQGFYSKTVYAYQRDANNQDIIGLNSDGSLGPLFVDVYADFEDMFLFDGERQLKIRFNPIVNSFKNDLLEQKIETIGSKHPFIFRNGNVCYKEFPIGGLISFTEDEAKMFVKETDIVQMNLARFAGETNERDYPIASYKTQKAYRELSTQEIQNLLSLGINNNYTHENLQINTTIPLVQNYDDKSYYGNNGIDSFTTHPLITIADLQDALNQNWKIMVFEKPKVLTNTPIPIRKQGYNKTNLTSDNIQTERYFKLLVLDWLTDGKVKLFRSATEGNYLVRLLNVSLTPKQELGRMIHEFTCTAYEIADFTYENLLANHIISNTEPITIANQWGSLDISSNLLNNSADTDGFININLNDKKLTAFSCINFAPGDQLKLLVEDNIDPIIITIGASGNYIYPEGKNVIKLQIKPNQQLGNGFSRDMSILTVGYAFQYFDTVAAITTQTRLGEEYVGAYDDLMQIGVPTNYDLVPKSCQYLPVTLTVDTYKTNTYYILSDNEYQLSTNSFNNELQYYKKLTYKYVPIDLTTNTYTKGAYYTIVNNSYKINNDNFDPEKFYYQKVETIDTNSNSWYKHFNISLMRDELGTIRGPKIRMSEILFMRAKKRIVIPIFKQLDNGYFEDDDLYSLTPFGQGYVRYKTIAEKKVQQTIQAIDSNLNIEEAKTLQDLVQFVITECNFDTFCLFHVYTYHNNEWQPIEEVWGPFIIGEATWNAENEQITTYFPASDNTTKERITIEDALSKTDDQLKNYIISPYYFYHTTGSNGLPQNQKRITGYYDPYVKDWWRISKSFYNQLDLMYNNNNSKINTLRTDYRQKFLDNANTQYNPTFTMTYTTKSPLGIELTATNNVVNLNEVEVYEAYNLEPPTHLKMGNGVSLELSYRLQCIDYTMENENQEVVTVKQHFLTALNTYNHNNIEYNQNSLIAQLYSQLAEHDRLELQRIKNQRDYQHTLKILAQAAAKMQKEKILAAWKKELNINNLMRTQVQDILQDLILGISKDDESLVTLDFTAWKQLQGHIDHLTSYYNYTTINDIQWQKYDRDNCIVDTENELGKGNWPNDIGQTITLQTNIKNLIANLKEQWSKYYGKRHYETKYTISPGNDNFNYWLSKTSDDSSGQSGALQNLLADLQALYDTCSDNIENLQGVQYVGQYINLLNRQAIQLLSTGVNNEWTTYYNNLVSEDKSVLSSEFLLNIYSNQGGSSKVTQSEVQALINGAHNISSEVGWMNYQKAIDFNLNISADTVFQGAISTLRSRLAALREISHTKRQAYNERYANPLDAENPKSSQDFFEQFKINNQSFFTNINGAYQLSDIAKQIYFNLAQIQYLQDNTYVYTASVLGELLMQADPTQETDYDIVVDSLVQTLKNDTTYQLHSDQQRTYLRQMVKAFCQNNDIYAAYQELYYIYDYLKNPAIKQELDNDIETRTFIEQLISDKEAALHEQVQHLPGMAEFLQTFNAQQSYYQEAKVEQEQDNANETRRIKLQEIINTLITYKSHLITKLDNIHHDVINYLQSDTGENIYYLWGKQQAAYQTAITDLNRVIDTFNINIGQLYDNSSNYIEIFYFNLLADYFASCQLALKPDNNFNDLEKQYTTALSIYSDAFNYLENNDSPLEQYEALLSKWKSFINKLAKTYKIEVKERFG